MNQDTRARLFTIGIIVAAVLFLVMLIDHFANDAGLITPLAIVYAVVTLLLLVLLFIPVTTEATTGTPEEEPDNMDYVGEVHEVVDLEGVGPAYADRLHGMGIQNTQELLFADPKEVAKTTGASPKTVENWRAMSQLIKVPGIGPQYAEALVRAGIDGIEELRDEPAAAIAGAVKGYLDSIDENVIGQSVTTKRVETWQKKAKKMKKQVIDMDNLTVMPLESKQAKADNPQSGPPESVKAKGSKSAA